MGMFDCYEPVPGLACPFCSTRLDGWQGKGGPCLMLTWRQLHPSPVVDDDGPMGHKLEDGLIGIYTSCERCGQWCDADAVVENRVWVRTQFEQEAVPSAVKADRILCAIDKFIENCPFSQDPELIPALEQLLELYKDLQTQGRWPLPKES